MIGDYIQDLAGDLCQVIVLDRQVAQVETLTGVHQGDTTRYLHEAEGVPITPEIMEKNGMSMNPYGEYFAEDKNYFLEMSREEEGFFWTINYNEYTVIPLNYVHELQHALRLCGIDKTITI